MTRQRNDTTVSITKCCLKKLSMLSDVEGASKSQIITAAMDQLLIQRGFDPSDFEFHVGFEPRGRLELHRPLSDAEIDAMLADL